jgi:formiminoglutamase
MLDMWLQPFSAEFNKETSNDNNLWSNKINYFTRERSLLEKGSIAYFGVTQAMADQVRNQVSGMSFPFQRVNMCDLNAARNSGHEGIFPILHDLVTSDIIPVLITGDEPMLYTQFMALHEKQNLVNLMLIDDRIPLHIHDSTRETGLHRILDEERKFVFNLSMLGYQRHLSDHKHIARFESLEFEHIRLGELKKKLSFCEPYIRDADLMHINLRAIKSADAPATTYPSTSGLTSEEICQLAYYAGMSDKMSALIISGYQPTLDGNLQTANTISQILWYFAEGFENRKGDYPVSNENMTEYIVFFKDYDLNIHFWKSNRSGRWWIEWNQPDAAAQHERHKLIPCSYEDYQLACRQELPDRLFHMMKK